MGSATTAERTLAERRMREINESWRVLRDAGRRRAYDEARLRAVPRRGAAGGSSARASGPPMAKADPRPPPPGDDLVDVAPGPLSFAARHLPAVAVLVVLGLIFVLTAYATGGTSEAPAPTVPGVVLDVGSCVDVAPGPIATVVPCEGPAELRVVARVSPGIPCPPGSEDRRLSNDGQTDCVVPA
jgi:hypothetical protein